MDPLSQEAWDALSAEEQATRQDEKPVASGAGEPDSKTVEELTTSVKDLKTQLDSLQNEKQGIYRDLKGEREVRQQLEATLQELQNKGKGDEFDLEALADEEYLTAGQVKKIMAKLKNTANNDTAADNKRKSGENYAADEERMIESTKAATDDFPVPYEEAIKEFQEMAKSKPAFWRTVHEESLRANGKPAEVAYKIALTSKKFMDKVRVSAREKLLKELEDQGQIKPRKLPSGGPGKTEINAANLSEEDLLGLSDAQLNELLEKTG